MDPEDLEVAIEDQLRADGVLDVVNGFYLQEANEAARIPYIVMQLVTESVKERTNCSRYFDLIVRLDCCDLSRRRAKDLARLVVASLDDDSYTTQDGTALSLYQTGLVYMEEVGFFRAIQSFGAVVYRARV